MIDKVKSIQRGTVYRIRNRKTGRCLSICSKIDIKTSEPAENADQLWVLNEVKNKQYQIIQVKEGSVLTYVVGKEGTIMRLEKDRITKDQFWAFKPAQIQGGINYFWIKPSENEQLTISGSALSDRIQLSSIDPTLNICLWQLEVYPNESEVFAHLSMFRSETSNLFLDISDIASKEGVNIIQYLFTGAGNQRWIIQPFREEHKQDQSQQYTIRNYSSGLNLAVLTSKGSFKIIQALFNSEPEQRWKLILVKEKTYLIQSVAHNTYYLGTINEKGGSLVSLLQDRLKSRWVIEGHLPSF